MRSIRIDFLAHHVRLIAHFNCLHELSDYAKMRIDAQSVVYPLCCM
nr:MAG TPA: hypothetical protein [Bacteriophage sp.]